MPYGMEMASGIGAFIRPPRIVDRVKPSARRTRPPFAEFEPQEYPWSGQHLLAEINKLIAEGNVRKLVVKTDDGHIFLTIPLTAGAVAGGVLTLGAPWLAVLAAVAGLVARVKIEVVREQSADAPPPSEEKPSASDEAA